MTTRKAPQDAPASEPTCADILADAPDGYVNASNPERAARALGDVNGKRFRGLMRDVLGVHVREGDAFGERERAYMYVLRTTHGTAARKALGDAFKSGAPVPPTS